MVSAAGGEGEGVPEPPAPSPAAPPAHPELGELDREGVALAEEHWEAEREGVGVGVSQAVEVEEVVGEAVGVVDTVRVPVREPPPAPAAPTLGEVDTPGLALVVVDREADTQMVMVGWGGEPEDVKDTVEVGETPPVTLLVGVGEEVPPPGREALGVGRGEGVVLLDCVGEMVGVSGAVAVREPPAPPPPPGLSVEEVVGLGMAGPVALGMGVRVPVCVPTPPREGVVEGEGVELPLPPAWEGVLERVGVMVAHTLGVAAAGGEGVLPPGGDPEAEAEGQEEEDRESLRVAEGLGVPAAVPESLGVGEWERVSSAVVLGEEESVGPPPTCHPVLVVEGETRGVGLAFPIPGLPLPLLVVEAHTVGVEPGGGR